MIALPGDSLSFDDDVEGSELVPVEQVATCRNAPEELESVLLML